MIRGMGTEGIYIVMEVSILASLRGIRGMDRLLGMIRGLYKRGSGRRARWWGLGMIGWLEERRSEIEMGGLNEYVL